MTAANERPVIVSGVGVTMLVSDCPDPVFGVVLDVHENAIGDLVASVQLRGRVAEQSVRFLKVRPAVTQ